MLEIAPATAVAYALLTTGGTPRRMIRAIRGRIFGELAGIDVPPPPTPPSSNVEIDHRRFIGRFQNAGAYYDVRPGADGNLEIEAGPRGALKEQIPDETRTFRTTGASPSPLISLDAPNGTHQRWAFPEVDDAGRAASISDGLRIALRANDTVA